MEKQKIETKAKVKHLRKISKVSFSGSVCASADFNRKRREMLGWECDQV
jgi:hypothetical protein